MDSAVGQESPELVDKDHMDCCSDYQRGSRMKVKDYRESRWKHGLHPRNSTRDNNGRCTPIAQSIAPCCVYRMDL